jgi:signal transduction histidine kinase
MVLPPIPPSEEARLAALRSYNVLDTPAEKDLDALVALASHLCGTAISQITLIDVGRQWFKASHGADRGETSRDFSFCAHAINGDGLFVVPDASRDARFADNPLVADKPHIRFYAGSPLVTPDGHAIGTLCVIDSKPRRLTPDQEAALALLGRLTMSYLEARKQAREAALATAALDEKNRALIEAAEAKNRFLTGMSHELRTPLNCIIGFSEILSDDKAGGATAEQKEYLGDILASGRHLLSLVNDVLDLAKVEAGKMTVHPAPFALEAAVGEIGSVMRSALLKNKIRFETFVDPRLGEAVLDVKLFKQILFNLLSNAVKFTDPGGSVGLRLEPAGEGFFSVKVSDTGIGIRAEDLPRLFQEFEQVGGEAAREKLALGTGLGLALTRRIVRLQGGEISVESDYGKGTTFTARLPLSCPANEG